MIQKWYTSTTVGECINLESGGRFQNIRKPGSGVLIRVAVGFMTDYKNTQITKIRAKIERTIVKYLQFACKYIM